MAVSEQQVSQGMLTAGFNRIDTALAANDARGAQMLDEYLLGVSRVMGKRLGINPNALRSMAKQMIQQRAAQAAQAERSASDAKAGATLSLGSSQRKLDLGMEGLRLNQEAFDRTMFRRYVGAAVQAAGTVIAEGIRSGLFEQMFQKPGDSKGAEKQFEAPKLEDPTQDPALQELKTLDTGLVGGHLKQLDQPSLTESRSTPLAELQLQADPGLLDVMKREPRREYHGGMRGNLYPDTPTYFDAAGPVPKYREPDPALYQLRRR
jgi:hypothetical protein